MERPPLTNEHPAIQALFPESDDYRKAQEDALDEKRHAVEQAVADADVLVISDTDLDGLGAAVFVHAAYGSGQTAHVTASHDEQVSIETTLRMVADIIDSFNEVYVCDLPPNTPADYAEGIRAIAQQATVTICDHHDEWTDEVVQQVEPHATVSIGNGISAAEVTYNTVADELDSDWQEFASLVTDHDCQYFNDKRSEVLCDYADASGSEVFIRTSLRHKAALTEQPSVKETVETYRTAKNKRIASVVNRVETTDYNGVALATTYGRCPASQAAERIYDRWDADVIVFIRPENKLNVRTRDAYPIARTVATYFGGGGHDTEAGAKPGFYGTAMTRSPSEDPAGVYTEPIDWATHWASFGREARRRALTVMQHVLDTYETTNPSD